MVVAIINIQCHNIPVLNLRATVGQICITLQEPYLRYRYSYIGRQNGEQMRASELCTGRNTLRRKKGESGLYNTVYPEILVGNYNIWRLMMRSPT